MCPHCLAYLIIPLIPTIAFFSKSIAFKLKRKLGVHEEDHSCCEHIDSEVVEKVQE
jgi:hypothetical protein